MLLSSTNVDTSGRLFLQNATAGEGYAILQENGNLDFRSAATAGTTSGTQRVRIDSSGNIGIGTTSPSSWFTGATNLVIEGSSDSGLTIDSGTASIGRIHFADGTTGTTRYKGIVAYDHSSDAMYFVSNASEAMRIDSSGNVGIGTTSPSVQLHVKSSATTYAQARIDTGADGYDASIAYAQAGTIKGISGYDDSTDTVAIKYGTFGGNGIDIDSSGNIGIGTTSPANKLEVSGGNIRTINSSTGRITFNNGSTEAYFGFNGAGSSILDAGALPLQIQAQSTNYIRFDTNGSERMRIDSSGNVGIGLTAPTQLLDVNGDARIRGGLNLTTSTSYNADPASYLIVGASNQTSVNNGRSYQWKLNTEGDANDQDLVFSALDRGAGSFTEYVRFQGSGNVGIGTNSPSAELHVSAANDSGIRVDAAGNNVALMLTDETTSNGFRINYNAPSDILAFDTTNGTGTKVAERMRIDSSGNVLVGTTNSDIGGSVTGVRLAQSGAIYASTDETTNLFSQPLYADRRGTNNAGDILALGLNGYLKSTIGVIGTSGTSDDGGITFNTVASNATKTERMRIDPSNLLINGTSRVNAYPSRFLTLSMQPDLSQESCPILELVGNRTASAGNQNGMIQFYNKTSTAVEVGRISSIQGSATNSGAFNFQIANAGTLSEAMRIDSSGNVGIGITSFNEGKLHVKSDGAGEVELLTLENSTGTNGKTTLTFKTTSTDATKSAQIFAERINASGHTDLAFRTYNGSTTERMRISSTGIFTMPSVYTNAAAPTYRDVYVEDNGVMGYASSVRASKTQINPVQDASWLYQVDPVTFYKKKTDENGQFSDTEYWNVKEYGFIAEDIEPHAPELCAYSWSRDENDNLTKGELEGVHYNRLVAPMLKLIQDQKALIDDLTARIETLENQ